MKQNVKNTKQQKKYVKRRIALVCIIALLAIILILNINAKRNLNKVALGENALNVGGETLDLSQVLSKDPNPPHLGAGMIPIKWNGTNWVITTSTDKNWYDYSKGNWATVMLSDGIYSSELERDKKLASEFVGTSITSTDDLGTIFTWIPRLCYSDTDVEFLKDLSLLEYNWTTESCFNLEGYGANYIDLAFKGIWVGQTEFANAQDLENKNNEMNSKENVHGLIANEKVQILTDSDRIAVEKLHEKIVGASSARPEEDTSADLINISTMKYRQTIKIVNTNNRMPIMATHIMLGDRVKITDKYSAYGIKFVTDKDGNKLEISQAPLDENNTTYTFYLVDNIGNIRKYKMSYGTGKPNLKGFNLSNTFYVIYDANGNETSQIPAGENPPEEWHDYENQRWANIVVRDDGNETYYTWIPRYMYKLDNENQRVDAKFVDLNNVWTDTEHGDKEVDLNRTDYVLPEAFTWEDPEDPTNKIQLSGFWMSKFKLRDGATTKLTNIVGGIGTITIKDIAQATNDNYICELYLIQNGKRIKWNEESSKYEESEEAIILKDTKYQYNNLEKGNYTINIIIKNNDDAKLQVGAITKEITVVDENSVNKPNIDNFNKDYTYYVLYDDEGKEDSSVRLADVDTPPAGWYNYFDRKWANIVVRIDENETYYTWIPRYEYSLDNDEQKTNVNFIPTTQKEPTPGYQIPEAFTWENPEDSTKQIQLDGYWMSKFKLREGVSTPSNNIYGVGNAIKINNIATNDSSYNYYVYAYSKEKDENGKSIRTYNKQITSKDNTLDKVIAGDYIVTVITKDKSGNHIGATSRDVTVIDTINAYEPDLSTYNLDITYYAEYNKEGTSIVNASKTLNTSKPNNWYNYDDVSNLAENPIIEATIVVRERDYNTYYKWIPRYEYTISDAISNRTYISTDKVNADDGYTIPSEFTDSNGQPLKGYWKQINKVQNTINATIVATDSQIKVTNITLPSNTTGKIKLTSNSQVVGEYDLAQIEGNSHTYSNLDLDKKYEVSIFAYDTNGNVVDVFVLEQRVFKVTVDVKSHNFNNNNTYYVVYDEQGNETSEIPVGEEPPENWYDYTNQKWANIVVRDNGNTTYYTWIPRYEYKVQEANQKTSIIFISQDKDIPDTGYQIPEAFTWEDPNNPEEKIQLAGYWMSKFKLREGVSTELTNIIGGIGEIEITNITQATNASYICELYLIKDGVRQNNTPIILDKADYKFSGLTVGDYAVNIIIKNNDAAKLQVDAITKNVRVVDENFVNAPNLDGFDRAHTYYVEYDANGNETSDKLITENPPTNWYNYMARKWANIVVRQNGNETYYTWIPRYGYTLDNDNQRTNVEFVTGTEDAPKGYTLPEAFTWEDPNNPEGKIQLTGYWMSKFKLREGATTANITLSESTIDMSKVATNASYTYTAYLYSNNDISKGQKIQEKAISSADATLTVSSAGHYTVTVIAKDATGNQISAVSQDLDYGTADELNAIDLQYARIVATNRVNEATTVLRKSISNLVTN